MASIFQNKKFNSYGVEVLVNKKRWRLYGLQTRRIAETFKENIEELLASEQIGGVSLSVKLWLNNLWKKAPEYYLRLVEMGLAEPRQTCGTLQELFERYSACPIDGLIPKEGTSNSRRTAYHSLLNFLANQKHSNFKRDQKALKKAAETSVEKITPEVVTRFYDYLQKVYVPNTWGRRIKHYKTMFNIAVSAGWIETNPFKHLKGCTRENHSRDFFINKELARKILAACPNARWRLIFSFARWGGLRMPSEISFLRWSDILWNSQKIRISVPKKTGRIEQERGNFSQRFIPIFPEIRTALEEFLQENKGKAETNDFVFPEFQNSDQSGALLRKQFLGILKKAGIPVWPKLFNNLRATRDTELQETYPLHKVCSWLGHSPQISLKHYTQMTDEDFRRASAASSDF